MTSRLSSRSEPLMGTIVTIATVGEDREAVDRAFEWFREVEAHCSRFDPGSELSKLSRQTGTPIHTSDMVFKAVQFAVAVAEMSGGAFDPVVGGAMAARGFNRHYLTGGTIPAPDRPFAPGATFRDLVLDAGTKTITLDRPLALDLGGVAKGLAIDLAARELARVRNFSIDAGGDLYLGGKNEEGADWSVGIRHPRKDRDLIDAVRVSDMAVCTSGDYERRNAGGHHLLNPATSEPASGLASVTVIAPTAMLADAASTAAFVLGPIDGLAFCRRAGVQAIFFTPNLERFETPGIRRQ